jgi:acyl-CoA synthetase (AMP-forming)/AMP-acid ligase II
MPHPKWGEAGVAVLVATDGATLRPEAITTALNGKLARYKWPARFVIWDDLPRSGYGKIVKRDVRTRLLAEGVDLA